MAESKKTKMTKKDKVPRSVQPGALLEHVDEKVDLVIEQFGGINRKLDEHTKKLDEHTRILDMHTQILDEHTETLGSMKVDIEVIKTDIEFIKHSLKRKVDIDEFAALERRVALLEKRA
jgi:hypothetical protein